MRVSGYRYYKDFEVPDNELGNVVNGIANNETRLYFEVVDYVRNQYNHRIKILPGLGEHVASIYASLDPYNQ
jgi:hypothetical protein